MKGKDSTILIGFLIISFFTYYFIFVFLFAIGYLIFYWRKLSKKEKISFIIIAPFSIMRVITIILGITIAVSEPPPRNVKEILIRLGPLKYTTGFDVGTLESILGRRVETTIKMLDLNLNDQITLSIKSDKNKKGKLIGYKDLYTKDDNIKWIKTNSKINIYSIGPDKIDSNAEIIYDPSNGVGSGGDLVRAIDN